MKRFIDTAYNKARELLLSHREELDLIANALLEFETLDANHIKDLMRDGEMGNPPPSPNPPDLDEQKLKSPKKGEGDSVDDGMNPGDLSPVGA